MEFIEVVERRTSVRTFTEKEVADDLIFQILSCGHKAPTAGNLQPWEFIIIKNPSLKQEIVKTTFVGNNEQSKKTQTWMLNASVFIIVCAMSRGARHVMVIKQRRVLFTLTAPLA